MCTFKDLCVCLLSYLATAGVQIGNIAATTMITAVDPNLNVNSMTLNLEPVFVELNNLAINSGAPLETFLQFGEAKFSKNHVSKKPYCPICLTTTEKIFL